MSLIAIVKGQLGISGILVGAVFLWLMQVVGLSSELLPQLTGIGFICLLFLTRPENTWTLVCQSIATTFTMGYL